MCLLFVLVGALVGFQATGDVGWGSLVAAAFMVVGAGLNYLIAMAVNSESTPTGRVWRDRSTVNGVSIQAMSVVFLVFALLWLAVAVGHWTTGLVGVLLFVVPSVAGLVLARRAMRRAAVGARTDARTGGR
jgi:hypothetical protein